MWRSTLLKSKREREKKKQKPFNNKIDINLLLIAESAALWRVCVRKEKKEKSIHHIGARYK